MSNQFALLSCQRFLPLFATQFLGAFNDNFFKNALVVAVTFGLLHIEGVNPGLVITLASGLFILPFFLFSATAGQLADKYEKSMLIRRVKLFEILLMCLAALGFATASTPLLLVTLFLMGTQSAFFGPLKYGILPQHLRDDELIGGNALVEMATFLAILSGTIAGGLLTTGAHGKLIVAAGVIVIALAGYLASRKIPSAAAPEPGLRVDLNFLRRTWLLLSHARREKNVFPAMLGIAWFWLVGSVFVTQFPNYAKLHFQGDEEVVTLFLTVFSLGVGIGSLLCNKLLKGSIHARYVPRAAVAMTCSVILLYCITPPAGPETATLIHAGAFLAASQHWLVLLALLGFSISGGVYIVPLMAILQHRADPARRSRTIAASNILDALFMSIAAAATAFLLNAGVGIPEIFLGLAVFNIPASLVARGFVRRRRGQEDNASLQADP